MKHDFVINFTLYNLHLNRFPKSSTPAVIHSQKSIVCANDITHTSKLQRVQQNARLALTFLSMRFQFYRLWNCIRDFQHRILGRKTIFFALKKYRVIDLAILRVDISLSKRIQNHLAMDFKEACQTRERLLCWGSENLLHKISLLNVNIRHK